MKIWIVWNSSEYAEDGLAGASLDEFVAMTLAKGNPERVSCWDTKLGFVQFTKIADYYFSRQNGWQRKTDPAELENPANVLQALVARICIMRRSQDFMVFLESNPGIWDCGETMEIAIEQFVNTWGSFGYAAK